MKRKKNPIFSAKRQTINVICIYLQRTLLHVVGSPIRMITIKKEIEWNELQTIIYYNESAGTKKNRIADRSM